MATRLPITQASGELQQLQPGDPLSPVAVGVLRVVDVSCTMPANTCLTFITSLTLSNNISFTIPSTCSVIITSGNPPLIYWDTLAKVASANFTTTSASLVDITGLTFAAAANALYEIETVLRVQSSSTNGCRPSIAFSGSGATGHHLTFGASTTTSALTVAEPLGTASPTYVTSATTNQIITQKAIVVTGANTGNITVQMLSASGDTITVYIGSIMKIKRLA